MSTIEAPLLAAQARERADATHRISPATLIVIAAATVLSVLAYLHFYPGGETIAYGDAKSHLLIARRVLFADTPGMGQLGGVWLPLPHVLMLPLIWNSWAYYSGFAGSVVMMVCYVVCTVLIYKFVYHLTGRRVAPAMAGAAVFALSPNVLYMQATPMTELLMFATMMGAVYGLLRWIQTDNHLFLLGAGLSAMLCGLTRYEGWTLAITLTAVVLFCSFIRRNGRAYSEGNLLAFGMLGAAAPLAWMLWNWAIFGGPLAFQTGAYAKPSLWVDSGEKTVHNLWISLRTYEIATLDNISVPVTIAAVIGLLVYLWRYRLSAQRDPALALPLLALLVMFPMFVVTLYKGQRPLHVYQYYYNFYNVRFGLVMILPAALLIGFLAAQLPIPRWTMSHRPSSMRVDESSTMLGWRWRWRWWRWWQGWRGLAAGALPAVVVIAAAVVLAVGPLRTSNMVTLNEPVAGNATPTAQHAEQAAAWLRTHYAGGLVLMEAYGNEEVAFASHVPLQDQVYEGSYRIWQPAISNPSGHHITWIVMRTETSHTDQVYKALFGSTLIDGYRQAWRNHDYIVYEFKG
jgi:hypothetical protein